MSQNYDILLDHNYEIRKFKFHDILNRNYEIRKLQFYDTKSKLGLES